MNSKSKDTSVHVRGGVHSYKLPKQNTSAILITPTPPPPLARVSTFIYTISIPLSLPYTWTVDGLC